MVYNKEIVAVVKVNGHILREIDGYVTLPFGSEYSIKIKNLEGQRAVVDVSIDGKDVLDGNRVVIDSNASFELKGEKINSKVKNRFKFIKKTQEIVEHRGDNIDDGLIRIEAKFEKPPIEYTTWMTNPQFLTAPRWSDWYIGEGQTAYFNGSNQNFNFTSDTSVNCFNVSCDTITCNSNTSYGKDIRNIQPEEGITVKGSETNQNFRYTSIGELETGSSVIIIQLKGTDSKNKEVLKPIMTRVKLCCETCGRSSRSSAKYCPNCGTYLQ